MAGRAALLRAVFYGGLFLVVIGVLTGAFEVVFPKGLATFVVRNNEGYVLLLLFAAWVEFVRPRLGAGSSRWRATGVAAVASAGLGFLTLFGPVAPVVATLNETFFALAFLFWWVELPRPVPRVAWVVPVVAAVIAIGFGGEHDVFVLAELFAALVLFPLALDVVDKAILRPELPTRLPPVVAWMVGLVAASVVLSLLRPNPAVGVVEETILFLSRTPEVVLAVVLSHLYFTILAMTPVRNSHP